MGVYSDEREGVYGGYSDEREGGILYTAGATLPGGRPCDPALGASGLVMLESSLPLQGVGTLALHGPGSKLLPRARF